ncbi:MAG: LytTR family DNA-binding domain-containing protein [Propionibacteriaceae bacterium]|jgi:DNA-binding LytR/AlgR family response regulator|nr:LytTR family DNA-binding domain-containing protein [Propionibacteriaceae bacterium]
MVRIGLVEDDPHSAQLLQGYLARYAAESNSGNFGQEVFQVTAFDDARVLLDHYRGGFDILLLDIQLPGIDGFQAAQRIRQLDHQVIIVFVTITPQYALKGYEVGALSYLLKPVSYVSFAREMQRSLGRYLLRQGAWLSLKINSGLVRVATSEIVFCESDKYRVIVHTMADDHVVISSIKAMQESLAGRGFFRCNSGYLVNLRHVVGVAQNLCRLSTGQQLLISRPRRKAFLAALTNYLGDVA